MIWIPQDLEHYQIEELIAPSSHLKCHLEQDGI